MKKILSFMLAAVMLVSAVPTAFAADYTQGTQVEYIATGTESYTITVPAKLNPGQEGTVTLAGTWADNRVVTVTAEENVTLTNSILASDQKVLKVTFDGISEKGNNIQAQTFTETVSVDGIENALFGTWSGKFNYFVETSDAVATAGCDTLYWDGNVSGKVIVGDAFVKISDAIYTMEDVKNGCNVILTEGGELVEYPYQGDWFVDLGNGAILQDDQQIICISTANTIIGSFTFEETGVYMPISYIDVSPLYFIIPGYTGFPHSEHCGH